jgi:Rrf2 family protein
MKLSRTTAYAIQASLQLARCPPGVPVPCSQMARDGQLPERFLLQVLRTLVNHGLMRSTRGVEGGYCLSRTPERITLLDIVEAFDNPLDPKIPTLVSMSNGVRASIMHTLHDVAHLSRVAMKNLTLADLLANDRTLAQTALHPTIH